MAQSASMAPSAIAIAIDVITSYYSKSTSRNWTNIVVFIAISSCKAMKKHSVHTSILAILVKPAESFAYFSQKKVKVKVKMVFFELNAR